MEMIAKMNVMLDPGAYMPESAYEWDAGYDLRTPKKAIVPPESSAVIDTGVHFEIPQGFVGLLKSKSGLNVKCGLVGEGVIDSGFSGSVVVKLYNHSYTSHAFETGDKIIQIIFVPIAKPTLVLVDSFGKTARGAKGFGSTGR